MTFWAALLALAWDQPSPLHRPSQFERLFARYADWVRRHFNAGTSAHALLAWAAAILPPALAAGLVGAGLYALLGILGLAWGAASLYYCLGFRQSVNLSLACALDLRAGDLERARGRLAGLDLAMPPEMGSAALTRLAIDTVLRHALTRLGGGLFWFVLLGPTGAVAYALTRRLEVHWRAESELHAVIVQVCGVLDWVPARLLALSFAVVGNFDAAMLAWRGPASPLATGAEDIVPAAGFGALGLDPDAANPAELSRAVRLVARATLLWLAVLGLFWLGGR